MSELPDSGEPGIRPPVPGSLPRPPLWTPGQEQAPFRGASDPGPSAPAGRKRVAFVAVGMMVVALVLLGLALVLQRWPLAVAGLVLGAAGAVIALRSRIMEDVSVSDSPGGPA